MIYNKKNPYSYDVGSSHASSESLWSFSSGKIYQLKLNDYTLNVIDSVKEGYEINDARITCSMNGPGLSFPGIRYADGQNVVGTIKKN